jgi:hypothetical protein
MHCIGKHRTPFSYACVCEALAERLRTVLYASLPLAIFQPVLRARHCPCFARSYISFPWLTLPSCAAKYKSSKALRDERALFEQLSYAVIYTTDEITTNLVLALPNRSITVQSDRPAIHHNISDGKIKIYVPADQQARRGCYRSQLPKLLASILGVTSHATFDIASIISCALVDLDTVLVEQDISSVGWIEQPVVVTPDVSVDERPTTPASAVANSDTATLLNIGSGLVTPGTSPTRYRRSVSRIDAQYFVETQPPAQYPDLIEQVVESARRASHKYRNGQADIEDATSPHGQCHQLDHTATFGCRNENTFAHDRRIGAAGEAYVRLKLLFHTHTQTDIYPGLRSTI